MRNAKRTRESHRPAAPRGPGELPSGPSPSGADLESEDL
jgi:hypothetical protein